MAGSTVSEEIGIAGDFINACAYAIELITFSLFFFEEGMQNFLRVYYTALLYKNQSDLMVLSYNDFDYMMKWWVDFYNNYGFLAVYSADGYAANMYMNLMYREYANILMKNEYMYYELQMYGTGWWHGVDTTAGKSNIELTVDEMRAWLQKMYPYAKIIFPQLTYLE